jgi:hypothetical protein
MSNPKPKKPKKYLPNPDILLIFATANTKPE